MSVQLALLEHTQKHISPQPGSRKMLALSAVGVLLGGISGGLFGAEAIAQVPNANLHCFLQTSEGVEYDLGALCPGYGTDYGAAAPGEVVLQTGDVQVTLRWDTADDLDLYVRDPFGEEVSYFNRAVASGGQLDVDANAGCGARMESPVENIFWPTGGGAPGDYMVTVDLFSYCGVEAPINFTLTTLVQGAVQTQSGTVSGSQPTASFPFSFAEAAGSASVPAGSVPTSSAPAGSATTALPPVPVGLGSAFAQ